MACFTASMAGVKPAAGKATLTGACALHIIIWGKKKKNHRRLRVSFHFISL
jgi:hypothetical protein